MTVTKSIRDMAMAVGFDAVGFAPASLSISAREQLKEFILKGYHGDMGWLEKRMKQRSQPKELVGHAETF